MAISGKAGQVDAPAEVLGINTWSLDNVVDTLESTDFDDAGVKAYIVGGSGWSGSFGGYKETIPLTTGGAAITIKLYESQAASQFWTGSAFITGAHISVAHDGIVTYSYDFQGTGALTIAAA